jgi:hypothetical protein
VGRKDPRIDAIIAKSQPFARPILAHLRKLVHQGCPEAEETLKWGMPHFLYGGGILCGMSSFKAHAAFGFWKGALVTGKAKGDSEKTEGSMGQFGAIASLKDLPGDKVMLGYIRKAMELEDQGIKSPTRGKAAAPKPPVKPPAYFLAALKKDKRAAETYAGFSPSQKREYVDWILEAKTEATRDARLATAVEWMAEGKVRMWKYLKKK